VIELVALHARLSESSPHDLRGVEALEEELPRRLGPLVAQPIRGREGPFGHTRWQDDLDAARDLLTAAGDRLGAALDAGRTPVLLASDCALALGTLPVLAERVPEARVLWLDAHSDYDTPATTTIGFLGCMSLAGACGAWDSGLGSMPAARVVHYGARIEPGAFDEAGHREAETSELTPTCSTRRCSRPPTAVAAGCRPGRSRSCWRPWRTPLPWWASSSPPTTRRTTTPSAIGSPVCSPARSTACSAAR
jgi:arginase